MPTGTEAPHDRAKVAQPSVRAFRFARRHCQTDESLRKE